MSLALKAEVAKTLLQRRAQRKSMEAFFLRAFSIIDPGVTLKMNWHIGLICEYLESCYEREIQNLIINMPPRNMKSNTCTVAFPAWVLGKEPTERFLCASYSASLSTKHSVDTRTVMESQWYKQLFPGTILAKDQNEKTKFQTTKRGHRIATSVGGTATGEGGNFLISDDPVNPKMAMSKVERENANNWTDQTWSTRKNDPTTAVEILVQQRLHVQDNTGHWKDRSDNITHLVIPQEAPSAKIFIFPRSKREKKVEKGELLHEARNSVAQISDFKKRLGSYGYAAQQQQTPSPAGGGIVKLAWFQRYDEPPMWQDEHKITLSIDSANKDKDLNDPSVAVLWQTTAAGHFLRDVWLDRVIYPDLKHKVIALIEKWRPNEIIIEDKASGQQLIQDLRRAMPHWPVIAMEPSGQGDKIVRMSNESPAIEAGACWLPNKASWLFDYEEELQNFPNAAHDDQVDMTSQFLRRVREPKEIFVG